MERHSPIVANSSKSRNTIVW